MTKILFKHRIEYISLPVTQPAIQLLHKSVIEFDVDGTGCIEDTVWRYRIFASGEDAANAGETLKQELYDHLKSFGFVCDGAEVTFVDRTQDFNTHFSQEGAQTFL